MKSWIQIFIGILVIVFCMFQIFKGPQAIKEPLLVPLMNGDQLKEQIQSEQKPVFVFFYHSKTETARYYLPALDQIAQKFNDKITFVRYKLSDTSPDPAFNQYWSYDSLVMFKNGQEVKQSLIRELSAKPMGNLGAIFMFIKDFVEIQTVSSNTFSGTIPEVNAEDFDEKVLNSSKMVLVNFFSKTCPHCKEFNPSFEEFVKQHSDLAEYYYCDVTDQWGENLKLQERLTHDNGTPTVALFIQGEFKGRTAGASSSANGNEASLWGLLVPHL